MVVLHNSWFYYDKENPVCDMSSPFRCDGEVAGRLHISSMAAKVLLAPLG